MLALCLGARSPRLSNDEQVIHALNQWMYEHWTFNYQDRIFPTPIITLPILDRAIAELEWLIERGARVILVRPAPVPGFMGPRSFALEEFDPFWKLVTEADLLVGMHASDNGYTKYTNEWDGAREGEMLPFKDGSPFSAIVGSQHRGIYDSMASAIGHGLCTRFPTIKIAPVETLVQDEKRVVDASGMFAVRVDEIPEWLQTCGLPDQVNVLDIWDVHVAFTATCG